MTKRKSSRRRSPSAPTPAATPASSTGTMGVKRYDVIVTCVLPRGGALVFANPAGHPCPPYIQQGQRMFAGMLIESAPEYVDELVRWGNVVEHVDPQPEVIPPAG